MLTKADIQYARQALALELMTYLGHSATGNLRPTEIKHLEYLIGLDARLGAAEAAAD